MTDDQIKAIAAQLESAARVEDAKFRREEDWVDNNRLEYRLIANRASFLRLAELLLCGAITEEGLVVTVSPQFDNEAAEPLFDKFERREDLVALEEVTYSPPRFWHDTVMT